jgi:hypothetical protein
MPPGCFFLIIILLFPALVCLPFFSKSFSSFLFLFFFSFPSFSFSQPFFKCALVHVFSRFFKQQGTKKFNKLIE